MDVNEPGVAPSALGRLSTPVCPVCNAPLRGKRLGKAELHFCPTGHGAGVDGPTLEAHEHRNTQQCAMHDVIDRAPRARKHGKTRSSPWYPGTPMELRQVEGITIDFCPVERGVWLDAPEILAIVNVLRRRPSVGKKRGDSNVAQIAQEIGGDLATQVLVETSDIWGEVAFDAATNGVKRAVESSDIVVEVLEGGVEIAGDSAAGIVEFIAEALS